MRSIVCVLYALQLWLQPGATSPQTSYGTSVAEDLDKSGAVITQNIHGGVVAMADPIFKFAVDTAPHLVHLYAILNGYDIPAPLAALAKDIYGRLAVFSGKALGRVGVFGSELAAGGLDVGANGLQALYDVLEAGSMAGIKLGAKVADIAADATQTGSAVVAGGMSAGGDGMMTMAAAARVLSQGISKLLGAIGARIVLGIASAEKLAATFLDDASTVVENGVVKFNNKQQERVYKAIQSYLSALGSIQVLLNDLVAKMQNDDSMDISGNNKSSSISLTKTLV